MKELCMIVLRDKEFTRVRTHVNYNCSIPGGEVDSNDVGHSKCPDKIIQVCRKRHPKSLKKQEECIKDFIMEDQTIDEDVKADRIRDGIQKNKIH